MTSSVKFITTFIFSILFVLIPSPRCDAQQERLTKNGFIRDKNHETLNSPAKVFQMGFFGLEPNQRYLEIWYYADPKTIVWVANRDNPVSSSSSFLTIENDGNLVVKDNSRKYFTTRLSSASRLSYARAMVELRAYVELKDTLVVVVPKFVCKGYTMKLFVLNTNGHLKDAKVASSKVNKISKSGSGIENKSLYETWKETYNEDSYDDDDFDECGLTDAQMKFANAYDINICGQLR
ncbi:G-type lectin S-receptor-like serine/threonine-protein kinase [Tanacetum coccineum]